MRFAVSVVFWPHTKVCRNRFDRVQVFINIPYDAIFRSNLVLFVLYLFYALLGLPVCIFRTLPVVLWHGVVYRVWPASQKKRSLQNDSNLYKWLRIPDSVLSRGKDMKHMFLDGAACCRSVVWYSVPCLYCVIKCRSLETTQNPSCKCLYIIKVYYCTLTAVVVWRGVVWYTMFDPLQDILMMPVRW